MAAIEGSNRAFVIHPLRPAVRRWDHGFTFVEILIVVAVIITLAIIIVGGLATFRESAALDQAVDEALDLLRDARSRTLASEGASEYGVHFEAQSITLFRGGAYVPGAPSNITVSMPRLVTISAITLSTSTANVVFARLSGEATATGIIRFTTARTGKIREVEITTPGLFQRR